MLLRHPPKTSTRRVTIRLPDDAWTRLDRHLRSARDAGAEIDIEGALADYLFRQIARAERQIGGVSACPPEPPSCSHG